MWGMGFFFGGWDEGGVYYSDGAVSVVHFVKHGSLLIVLVNL